MDININISERFASFIQDWDYENYLVIGGYGSGKSYNAALKIVFKLLEEKRVALVVRNVFETFKDSCYALLREVINDMGLLATASKNYGNKIVAVQSPMEIRFPNGSKIIFRGLDNKDKIKSIHGVSIVWIEECSEIRYDAYKELLGRVRQPNITPHFILTCNPVGKENWVYNTFFKRTDSAGKERVICDEEELYKRRTMICRTGKNKRTYYHHSTVDDNEYVSKGYVERLSDLRYTDPPLWVVARFGRFGANGTRVLPKFTVAKNAIEFVNKIKNIPSQYHFFGLDFGFEESFNALISCCVDDANKILYIYDEIYVNKITDDRFIQREDVNRVAKRASRCDKPFCADSAEPKTIQYYRQAGFNIYGARKYIGSRLQNTKKIKRFKKIVCSPKCKNVIRELQHLTYKTDSKGNVIYDEFNIDPHTFSALWYALDTYTVADIKYQSSNSKKGEQW